MHVVLHEYRARVPYSALTALVTASSISHASIVQGTKMYDTNIQRGKFWTRDHEEYHSEADRIVIVFDIPELDASAWIDKNMGVEYNNVGLFLWPFNLRYPDKMFCFEAVDRCLLDNGIELPNRHKAISGKTLMMGLTSQGRVGKVMRTHQLYEKMIAGDL